MPESTPVAYLIPRPLPRELNRTRRFRSQTRNPSKITLLEAPSGYGKTTLLAQWARAAEMPVIWLTLSPDEADPYRLCTAIGASAQVQLGELDWGLFHTALEAERGLQKLSAVLASTLNRATGNAVLVLDNADYLGKKAAEWLESFLGLLGEGMITWIAHHGTAPVELGRILSAGQAQVITSSSLAFSVRELRAFLSLHRSDQRLSRFSTLEGWPAGIALSLEGASHHRSSALLIEEILTRLPEALRNRLPELAVLEVWSEPEARSLGLTLPKGWLAEVMRVGLPVTPLGKGQARPHQFLLDVLEAELEQDPERHREMHIKAAAHAGTEQAHLKTIRHLKRVRAYGSINALLEQILPTWDRRSDWVMIREVLENLPQNELSNSNKTYIGVALAETGEPIKAEALLQQIADTPEANGLTFFGLALLAFRQGQMDQAIGLTAQGLKVAKTPAERIQLLRVRATVELTQNQGEAAEQTSAECLTLAQRYGDVGYLIKALSQRQYVLYELEDFEQSALIGRQTFDLALEYGFYNLALPVLQFLVAYHSQNGDLPACWDLLGSFRSKVSNYPLADPYIEDEYGMLLVQQGRFAEALVHFRKCGELFNRFGMMESAQHNTLTQAIALLKLNDIKAARILLERASRYRQPTIKDRYRFALALLHLKTGQLTKAHAGFKALIKPSVSYGMGKVSRGMVLAYIAETERLQGNLNRRSVNAMMDWYTRKSKDIQLSYLRFELTELFEACIAQGWFVERLTHCLEGLETPLNRSSRLQLHLTTLGNFGAEINGRSLPFPYAKVGELLAFLALNRSGTRKEIGQRLWGSDRRANVSTALRNLRECFKVALDSQEDLVERKGEAYFLSPKLEVVCDAVELDECSTEEAEQALSLYQGDFLPEFSSDWVLQTRSRLSEKAVLLATAVGNQYQTHNPKTALRWYCRAAELGASDYEVLDAIEQLAEQLRDNKSKAWVQRLRADLEVLN